MPLKVKMPGPVLVQAPTPLITPLKVELVPESARNVPPPALRVMTLVELIGYNRPELTWTGRTKGSEGGRDSEIFRSAFAGEQRTLDRTHKELSSERLEK